MKTKHEYKTFLRAYSVINTGLRKFRPFLQDRRLTLDEKKMLKALMAIIKDKPKKALGQLDKVDTHSDFLKGYQSFLYGIAYNQLCKYNKAAKALTESIQIFDREEYKVHQYRPIAIISKVYLNIQDLQRLEKYYEVFKKCRDESHTGHQILDLEYQIFIALLRENSKEGLKLIEELTNNYKEQIERSMSTYLTLAMTFNIQLEDYDKCYELLEQYKNAVGVKLKYNFVFILSMLNYITKDAKIYAYKKDFEKADYLFYQIKCIQEMQRCNADQAKLFWEKLQKSIPELYGDDFEYLGTKDLFSKALTKAKNNIDLSESSNKHKLDLTQLQNIKSAGKRLEYIMNHSDSYIDKYELIELIWSEPWTPKHDTRLRTLISRLRSKSDLKIDYLDGKYKKAS